MSEADESQGSTTAPDARRDDRGTLPNLIIAGVKKGGTTSLAYYLAQHPDIATSGRKKVAYFVPAKYGRPLDPIESYAAHFAGRGDSRYRLEATTGYFLGAAAVAEPMAETLPDVRVIISLRDPVDSLWSHYRFVRAHVRIDPETSFEDYVAECRRLHEAGEAGLRENAAWVAYEGGFYDEPMQAWIDSFGDRLKIVFFDDLKRDSAAVLTDVFEWLDLPTDVDGIDFDTHNQSVQVKNARIQKVALRTNVALKPFFRRHHGLKRRLRSMYYAVNRDRAPSLKLDPDFRAELRAVYRPSIERLHEQVVGGGYAHEVPAWLAGEA
ncbi:MAG: sulfotransferase [Acidimicrobiales bacterium]